MRMSLAIFIIGLWWSILRFPSEFDISYGVVPHLIHYLLGGGLSLLVFLLRVSIFSRDFLIDVDWDSHSYGDLHAWVLVSCNLQHSSARTDSSVARPKCQSGASRIRYITSPSILIDRCQGSLSLSWSHFSWSYPSVSVSAVEHCLSLTLSNKCIVTAVASVEATLNVIAELVGGYALPGRVSLVTWARFLPNSSASH